MRSLPTHRLLLVALPLLLVLLWTVGWREIGQLRDEDLRYAETATAFEARIFAENADSKIKRIDELLLDLRGHWAGGEAQFAQVIQARQAHITDITFQISIIDVQGHLVYSNLASASERVYLGDREHFKVHRGSGDQLFISQPVKGRVSGKWSIQFTRPILAGSAFKGVIVASVSPEIFTAINANLGLGTEDSIAMVRTGNEPAAADKGILIARHPGGENYFGRQVYVPGVGAPLSGTFTRVAALDGIERIYGYAKLPEFGLAYLVGHSMRQVLQASDLYRRKMVGYLFALSLLLGIGTLLLYRVLAQRERALTRLEESRQQQQLLSAAIAQSNASVMMTDLAGNITFVNDAFVRTSGYAREEVIGRNPRLLKSGHFKSEDYAELWRTLSAGKAWLGELQNRKKNGEIYWEFATLSPVIDAQGKVIQYIAVKEDITERKRQETELRHAKEEAESASLAKSQFLATMSHEIRTPLNGVLGMAQLLLMSDASKNERDEYARIILNSGHTLQTLLNDILDLSKVEAGRLELVTSPFDPQQAVEETAALFAGPARRKGLGIEARWNGPTGRRYLADPIRVRQVLANFVSNAIKFTGQGMVTLEASEKSLQGGTAELLFSITDTGIGIPQDKLARLFQPFSQLDNSNERSQGGSGLGLSIARNLAELMGGTAGVSSTEGVGSSFWFTIRADVIAATGKSAQPQAKVALPAAAPQRQCHIMIVDDNKANLRLLELLLAKRGYRVVAHLDGRAAIEALSAARPDLVLMDCQMPVMDGFAATAEIRRREEEARLARLPIIALTAAAYHEDREQCLASGMDDYLTKPIDINKLYDVIDDWLSRSHLQ